MNFEARVDGDTMCEDNKASLGLFVGKFKKTKVIPLF